MHERSFFVCSSSVLLLLCDSAGGRATKLKYRDVVLDSDIFPLATVNYLDGNLLSLNIFVVRKYFLSGRIGSI